MSSARTRRPHALLRPRPRTTARPPPRWSPKQVYAWAVLFAAIVLAVIIPTQAPRTAAHPALERKWGKREGGTVGVAFHLVPESGLASIYDKNGSTINVARIPGSPAYAAFMRNAASLSQARPRTRFCDFIYTMQIELPDLIPTPLSCLAPAVLAVRPLIAALKAEVEAHLGTRICFAALVVDDVERGPLRQVAAIALESVGLANVRVTRGEKYRSRGCLPSSRYEVDDVASHSLFPIVDAQIAHMEPLPADDEKAWTVLVVHYEPHGFNTARFWVGGEQDAKVPWGAKIQTDPETLGKEKERVRAVPRWLAAPVVFEDADSTWAALDARLHAEPESSDDGSTADEDEDPDEGDISPSHQHENSPPDLEKIQAHHVPVIRDDDDNIPDTSVVRSRFLGPKAPPHIDRLILTGASARDPKLHALLTDILGEKLTAGAYVDEDPFTAARGVAAGAYAAMQKPSFGAKNSAWPIFACQCASGLHASRWWDVALTAKWELANRLRYDARNTVEWIRWGYSGGWEQELRRLPGEFLDGLRRLSSERLRDSWPGWVCYGGFVAIVIWKWNAGAAVHARGEKADVSCVLGDDKV